MANLDINQAQATTYDSLDAYSISTKQIDSPSAQNETTWTNEKATQYWGYFNSVGDLKSAFLMKAIWNVGKGWTADPLVTTTLDFIKGWGKDTFDDILFNMEVCRRVFGDSFAEIITHNKKRLSEGGKLVNLIPLNPADVRIVVNRQGRIIRYEFINQVSKKEIKYDPEEIFHLSHNRLANQIHGISDIDTVEAVILAEQNSFDDMKKVIKFQAKPFILFKLKTDDEATITALAAKIRNLREKGEDMFIPDDQNILSYEVVQVNPSSILMEWRADLKNKFYRMVGMPLILFGSSGSTESGGKIEYLGHEQVFEHDQRYLEKQIWNQLGLKINLIPPTSLLENLQTDQNKDAAQGMEIQRNDVTAGQGR